MSPVLIVIGVLAALVSAFLLGCYAGRRWGIPVIAKKKRWSIGIYTGTSPLNLIPAPLADNPVLMALDVTDVRASFVADPFMLRDNGTYCLFFEVMNRRTRRGEIGHATSADGMKWRYQGIVLREPFHLSYPYVFKWEGQYYLMPESYQARAVRLYEATEFPGKWKLARVLVEGDGLVDPSILRYDDKWWLFVWSVNDGVLRLLWADSLMGSWVEHHKSPVVTDDRHHARPGGRAFVWDGRVVRFAQDDYPRYGVHAFEITQLTTDTYQETRLVMEPPLHGTGHGWNAAAMHHVDPICLDGKTWIACVDGRGKGLFFGFRHWSRAVAHRMSQGSHHSPGCRS